MNRFTFAAILASVLLMAVASIIIVPTQAQEPPADTTPPQILGMQANPSVLWPPNHKMRNVTVEAVIQDDTDTAPTYRITSVESNEPVVGPGSGNTTPDWEITGDHTLKLRAERSGTGNGRVYTITIEASDASGNATTGTVQVTVPHDKGKKKGKNK